MHAYISHTSYMVSCSQKWKKSMCRKFTLSTQSLYISVYDSISWDILGYTTPNFEQKFSYLRAFLSWLTLHAYMSHSYYIVSCSQSWKRQSADHLFGKLSTCQVCGDTTQDIKGHLEISQYILRHTTLHFESGWRGLGAPSCPCCTVVPCQCIHHSDWHSLISCFRLLDGQFPNPRLAGSISDPASPYMHICKIGWCMWLYIDIIYWHICTYTLAICCMYVCMYGHICKYMVVYLTTTTGIHTYTCIYIHTFIYASAYMIIHTYAYSYIHTYTYTHTSIYMQYMEYIHIRAYTHIHAYIQIHTNTYIYIQYVYVCVCMCMYVYANVCMKYFLSCNRDSIMTGWMCKYLRHKFWQYIDWKYAHIRVAWIWMYLPSNTCTYMNIRTMYWDLFG